MDLSPAHPTDRGVKSNKRCTYIVVRDVKLLRHDGRIGTVLAGNKEGSPMDEV